MPAPRFFLLFEQIERVRGKEYADECYVARSASLVPEAFHKTVEQFEKRGEKRTRPKDLIIPVHIEPEAMKSTSQEARSAVMALFGNDPKINRKVLVNPIVNPHPRRRH